MDKMKLPCVFGEIASTEEDKRFAKCVIKVQHDKANLNDSYFDKKDMENCAAKSLRLTPILGSVVYAEDSEEYKLNGHDMEYRIVQNEEGYDLKISHVERIYGYVPHDAEISFEYDEDEDKTFLVTEGYLWKNYMDELEEILNRKDGETEVSMEISVNDSFEREDGLIQITDYTFEGITMLGVPPAMKGANLQLFSEDVVSKLKLDMEDLIQAYSLEKEEKNLNKNEQTPGTEFSLSVDNITDQVISQLNARLVEREDYWGDKYQARGFYYMDLLPDEKIVIVENADYSCRQYFGVPYSVNEDVVTLDFDNKKSYIQEWREMSGDVEPIVFNCEDVQLKEHIINKFNSIDTHEKEIEELNNLKTSYAELMDKFEDMKDYDDLKKFKESYDKAEYESEINNITSKFSFEEDEISELREKAMSKEMSKEQYEKELYCLLGMKQLQEKEKFSRLEKPSCEVKVQNNVKISSRYGELGKKYSK